MMSNGLLYMPTLGEDTFVSVSAGFLFNNRHLNMYPLYLILAISLLNFYTILF